MAKWETHVDLADSDEETEVHEVKLHLVILEVSRQRGKALWDIILVSPCGDVVGKEIYSDSSDLLEAKRKAILHCMKILGADGDSLGEAMQQTAQESIKLVPRA